MPRDVEKVVCYVIHAGHLLVLTHDAMPLVRTGVQVPAGSIEAGETAAAAAERELLEETGRPGRVVRALGVERYDLRPTRDEIAVRRFLVMRPTTSVDLAERWSAGEPTPSHGGAPIRWTCWWLPVEDAHVLAAGLGALVGRAAHPHDPTASRGPRWRDAPG